MFPGGQAGVARFDRYLMRQLMALFGFFALVLVMVYWVNRAVLLFDQLIADGQSAGVFVELTLLTLPNIIRIVLPLSAFVAAVYVTNRLSADSEMLVMQATGFSPFRLARPFLIFGLIVTALTGALTHFLVPLSVGRLNDRQAEIAMNATTRILQEGQFLSPTAGVTVYIREITPAGELRDIFLSDARSAVESVTYTAASAYLVRTDAGPQLVMVAGLAQTLRHADRRLITTAFSDLAYDIGGLMPAARDDRRSAQELPTPLLLFPTPATEAETRMSAGELVAAGHDRTAQALLAVVGAMLGFAALMTGSFSRFGLWRQIGAAVALVIFVKLIEAGCVAAVRADPRLWALIYLPGATGLVIGWLLLSAAARPWALRRRAAA